jgi:hypothetical protein
MVQTDLSGDSHRNLVDNDDNKKPLSQRDASLKPLVPLASNFQNLKIPPAIGDLRLSEAGRDKAGSYVREQ